MRRTVQKIGKNAINSTFSRFKPNNPKQGGNDFEFFSSEFVVLMTFYILKKNMSRKIPIREIFAPDSAKNCKKSQKFVFFKIDGEFFKKQLKRIQSFFSKL